MRKKYVNNNGVSHKNNANSNNKRGLSLPSPATLESYEEISPGFTKKLMELVSEEQEQRKNSNALYLKLGARAIMFGKFLAFVFSFAVLTVSFCLFTKDNFGGAAIIFITWFVFLFLINRQYSKLG
jgi:uncharacterized membrane protein